MRENACARSLCTAATSRVSDSVALVLHMYMSHLFRPDMLIMACHHTDTPCCLTKQFHVCFPLYCFTWFYLCIARSNMFGRCLCCFVRMISTSNQVLVSTARLASCLSTWCTPHPQYITSACIFIAAKLGSQAVSADQVCITCHTIRVGRSAEGLAQLTNQVSTCVLNY